MRYIEQLHENELTPHDASALGSTDAKGGISFANSYSRSITKYFEPIV